MKTDTSCLDDVLDLSRNEGRAPRCDSTETSLDATDLSRYPDLEPLRRELAELYRTLPDRILITAGGDDAILRLCLAELCADDEALVATPTFEMIPLYVRMARGLLREVAWTRGRFPTDEFLAAASDRTRLAFVVSPNNPTGLTATADDLRRIATALPGALVVLDAAYEEFADDGLTATAAQLDNVVTIRTLSKAWSLAGLRVGCAIGPPAIIDRLDRCGNPMPVSAASARIAERRLRRGREDVADHVAAVRHERERLTSTLDELGVKPVRGSQGNFVLVRGVDPGWVAPAMASLGVKVRRFPGRDDLRDAVRIGLPGDPASFERLIAALRAVLRPAALLFDMDGVLADVSGSYRVAIEATARDFGVTVTQRDIEEAKARGDANDDWTVTHRLITSAGAEASRDDVILRFESRYRELKEQERPMVDAETLRRWAARYPLAVVTGRPRSDAEHFLSPLRPARPLHHRRHPRRRAAQARPVAGAPRAAPARRRRGVDARRHPRRPPRRARGRSGADRRRTAPRPRRRDPPGHPRAREDLAVSQPRTATVDRATRETDVRLSLDLDGAGRHEISTGLPFLDHMLEALALHARVDLTIEASGDLNVDDHHVCEDVALALGEAIDAALGERTGIARFGSAHVPLDEALCRAVIDLSGRPWPAIRLGFVRERIGACATENLTHFFQSLAMRARVALHVDVLAGENDHHKAESAFKAVAVALRAAVRRDGDAVPSTKGAL